MEGSHHIIGSSDVSAVSIDNFSLPDDYLQLHINSNGTYSKTIHLNNNCYHFMIEFEQPAAESFQYRINQCNHYQVISAHILIRSTLGMALQPTSNTFLASSVLISFSPVTTTTTTAANMPLLYRSKLGLLDEASYKAVHEDLHSMHVSIHSHSLAEDINHSRYEQVYTLKTPPMISSHHSSTPQVTLLCNKRIHSTNNTYFNCPYSTYPPDIGDMSLVLLAYPKVIRSTVMSRQHLSSLQV